jgi:hypothetical protein
MSTPSIGVPCEMSTTCRRRRVLALVVVAAGCLFGQLNWGLAGTREDRQALWSEIRPVALKNCTLRRFGSVNDGGYLMCENLITGIESAYSYGIDTEDDWGCEVSQKVGVGIHQYDCFTPNRPICSDIKQGWLIRFLERRIGDARIIHVIQRWLMAGRIVFHNECIGPRAEMIDSHSFDTLANQTAKNGDTGKHLLVKMDIEGAEWESLMATPDEVLEKIDQLPMELHGVDKPRFAEVIRKLKQTFYLVSVHFNNHACSDDLDPFPSWAFQVLFVNKRLAVLDPAGPVRQPGSPPDAPDNLEEADCQPNDFFTTK